MSPSAPRPQAYRPMRLLTTALMVLAVMALGLVAGRWQWERYEVKHDALAMQHAAEDIPPVPLSSLLTLADEAPGDAQWRRVTVEGVLDADAVMALRGRSIDDTASLQYVTWLTAPDGTSVLVNLGWMPRATATEPALPAGTVTVTGVVRALEPDNGKPGTRITPAQVGSVDGEILPAYLMATSTCGDAACVDDLAPVPLPELSEGPHLSYALQWWLLMVAAAPIAVAITRRDARLERELSGEAASRPEREPRRPRRDRGPSDEEIEDAL